VKNASDAKEASNTSAKIVELQDNEEIVKNDETPNTSTTTTTTDNSTAPTSTNADTPASDEPTLDPSQLPADATMLLNPSTSKIPSVPQPRNFCVTPPPSTEHLFSKLTSPLGDEIDAHMELFNALLGGGDYVQVVLKSAEKVVGVLEKYVVEGSKDRSFEQTMDISSA
jgi:hypothetical protein